jgi:hypothetical protein
MPSLGRINITLLFLLHHFSLFNSLSERPEQKSPMFRLAYKEY